MKIIKIVFVLLLFCFLVLFLSYQNGYYRNINKEKMLLTDEKIKEYEEDLKNGVDVSQKDYIVNSPTYDNVYTRKILSISNIIEDGLNSTIKYFFKKIGSIVDE